MALRAAILATLVAIAPGPAAASWINPGPGDAELERIVRAAYTAAAAYAKGHVNYFARDGEFDPLRVAVSAALAAQGLPAIVPRTPATDIAAAQKCLAAPGIELRIAVNAFGDGLSLVAVTSRRVFAYHYDPHEAAAIVVTPAQNCSTV